jgi:hypothetical protein
MPLGFGIEHGPKAYSIVDLLLYFNEQNILLINIGDSISLQLNRAIVNECIRYYGDDNITISPLNLNEKETHIISITIPNTKIAINFAHVRAYSKFRIETLIKILQHFNKNFHYKHYVIIYNIGLHWHDKKDYEKILLHIFDTIQKSEFNMTFFYKQTSYQHFNTDSGMYHSSQANTIVDKLVNECVPHNYNYDTMYQQVEDKIVQLVNDKYHKSNGKILLRPINVLPFRHTSELWDLHCSRVGNMGLDCTHFVEYTPMLHQPLFYTLHRYFLGDNFTIA